MSAKKKGDTHTQTHTPRGKRREEKKDISIAKGAVAASHHRVLRAREL